MNISFIVLNPFTHDARVTKEAQTLVEAGHKLTVNAIWVSGLPHVEITPEGIIIKRIRLRSKEGIYIPFLAWIELLPRFVIAVLKQRPHACHAHDLIALIPAWIAAKLSGAYLIYDSHELYLEQFSSSQNPPRWKRRILFLLEKWLIRKAYAVITVSESISMELATRYSISLPFVIRNCPKLVALPSPGRLREWLGISPKIPIVFYQGNIVEGRGLEIATRAIAQIPDTIFVLLGEGSLSTRLWSLATQLGISDRIYMPGKVPLAKLLDFTSDATLGLCLIENTCLNHYYSLPNKLFDYLLAGVPVLASNFPEINKVILGIGAGLTTDPADIESVISRMREMLNNPILRAEFSLRGRQSTENYYNWQEESQALLAIYNKLMKKL